VQAAQYSPQLEVDIAVWFAVEEVVQHLAHYLQKLKNYSVKAYSSIMLSSDIT
jgi:hypothetical protein